MRSQLDEDSSGDGVTAQWFFASSHEIERSYYEILGAPPTRVVREARAVSDQLSAWQASFAPGRIWNVSATAADSAMEASGPPSGWLRADSWLAAPRAPAVRRA
jgi:hypothetical protein